MEVPKSEQNTLEVKEVKSKDMKNLDDYGVFELVEDVGQECIESGWVVTRKEVHDGQKMQIKARLVARGFQEVEMPQSDYPEVAKESLKVLLALASNEDFELPSMDIRAAFLQAKVLDREVYMKPPEDRKVDGYVWKLKKTLYGLDDASQKFCLKLKEILVDLGLKVMPGDEEFYYLYEDERLVGAVLTHVDDLILAGNKKFVERIREGIAMVWLSLRLKEINLDSQVGI